MEESEFIGHTSCEACGSSDANALYSNNTSFCFACNTWAKTEEDEIEVEEIFDAIPNDVPEEIKGFRERQIKTATCQHYDVRCKVEADGSISKHFYPYTKAGEVTGWKVREVATKGFSAQGDKKGCELFGQSLFQPGGRKLVITEGELDALAVAQVFHDRYKQYYPVVSLPDGAQSARRTLVRHRDWIRSFDEVVVWFDNDEPGLEATQEACKVIGADKARVVNVTDKDANDALLRDPDVVYNAVWNATKWQPAGIINGADTWDMYQSEKDAVYQEFPPFLKALNKNIHGVRTGSITMLTSGTGCGKTTFVKEMVYHILNTTEDQIGLVSLEESVAETVRGFISLHLSKRVGLPGVTTDEQEERAAFDATLGTGRIQMLDHQGSCEDSSLLDKLEFLAVSGCKYIILDHITIAVSETADGNTNNAIDALMSQMLKMTKRHDVHITCISHLRKVGGGDKSFEEGGDISMDDLRGSGSLKQISAQVIALSRNLSAENDLERNLVKIKVLKDRWTGATGWAGCYRFDFNTGRLEMAASTDEHGFAKEA